MVPGWRWLQRIEPGDKNKAGKVLFGPRGAGKSNVTFGRPVATSEAFCHLILLQ